MCIQNRLHHWSITREDEERIISVVNNFWSLRNQSEHAENTIHRFGIQATVSKMIYKVRDSFNWINFMCSSTLSIN